MKDNNIDKITDFLLGSSSKEDNQKLHDWITSDSKNADSFRKIKKAWETKEKSITPTNYVKEDMQVFMSKINSGKKIKLQILKYAAVLILALFSGYIWFISSERDQNSEILTFSTKNGEQSDIILSDGTKVRLSAATTIKYPEKFKGDNRKVKISGEALFEVAHDKHRPFELHSHDIVIKVLGTKFNVRSYSDSEESEVILLDGSVEAEIKSANGNKSNRVLKPGDKLTYHNLNNKIVLSEYNKKSDMLWLEKKLLFKNKKFSEIALELERFYDITIVFKNKKAKDFKFTAAIKKQKIEEVLDAFKLISYFEYSVKGKIITIK